MDIHNQKQVRKVCERFDGGFQQFIMQLLVFINAHLAMKPGNAVALFGYKRGDR